MNEELKPCPSCLGEAKLCFYPDTVYGIYQVKCIRCPIRIAEMFNREDAIAAWNRRAPLTNWIKCDDLMPLVSETKLLICDIDKEILVAIWDGYRWQLDEGAIHRDYNVTHWMLLQPPEQE